MRPEDRLPLRTVAARKVAAEQLLEKIAVNASIACRVTPAGEAEPGVPVRCQH